jgi:hypothetical protein
MSKARIGIEEVHKNKKKIESKIENLNKRNYFGNLGLLKKLNSVT